MHSKMAFLPGVMTAAMLALATGLPAADMPMLCPQPKEARRVAGEGPLDVAAGVVLKLPSTCGKPVQWAAARLRDELGRLATRAPGAAVTATVYVGGIEDFSAGEFRGNAPAEMVSGAAQLPAEGYLLRVAATGAIIVGKDVRGTVYGVETLIQLVQNGPLAPALDIRDYPDMAWRMTYCAGGEQLDERIRRIVRLCVAYKLNMIVFENPDFYRLADPEAKRRLLEVFTYCTDMGIEPIAELQSFGWSQYILPLDPLCVEAAPVRDRRFQFAADDLAQPYYKPGQDLAVLNGEFDQGDGHRITGWQQDDSGATIFLEASEKGGKCLKIQRTTPGFSRVSQRVQCEANTSYEMQVDMKTEAGLGFAAYFEVYGFPNLEIGREFLDYPHLSTSTGWERRTLRFRSGRATELVVYLRLQDGTGTAWFDNVTIKTAPGLPLVNVVETPDQPIVVASLDRKTIYAPGVDYDVKPGELQYPFAETATPWQISRRQDGAIRPGEEILVSYEWAEPGNITYCPSEPRTQALMKRAIAETIGTFTPRLLHLGHDEPRVMNRDSRCRKRGLEAHELYVDDLKRIHRYVQEVDPACRIMVWADTFRVNENGEVKVAWFSDEKCKLADAIRDVPKDIIMCAWRYSETDVDLLYRDLVSLTAAGFDVTGSPWYDLANAAAWGRAVVRAGGPSAKCLALFLTTWEDRWDALPLTSDLMWTLTKPEPTGENATFARDLTLRYARFATYRP
jgi:hypothetical protein